MAVVCACLITYRPLFTDLDLTFLSSLHWNKRSSSTWKRKEQWTGTGNTNDSYDPMQRSHTGNVNGETDVYRLAEPKSEANGHLDLVNIVGPPVRGSSYSNGRPSLTRSVETETSHV